MLQINQVFWYPIVAFLRPAQYAEGTFQVRWAGNGIISTYGTDTISGVFYRGSQPIWIASSQQGPGFIKRTKPTVIVHWVDVVQTNE